MVKTQREIALIRFNRATKAFKAPYISNTGYSVWQWISFVNPLDIKPENQKTQFYASTSNTYEAITKNKKLLSDLQTGLMRAKYGSISRMPFDFEKEVPNGVIAKLQETIAWQENFEEYKKEFDVSERIAREKDELLLLTDKQRADLFYSNLEKEKREKELQKAINIEIQNEMQPIDIEILPTIVKPTTVKPITVKPITVKPITVEPLDIDHVKKITITSALAIGLAYLVLTK